MQFERWIKESFTVIGKEGSTADGPGFVQRLWADANAHFSEVQPLAKTDAQGRPAGVWGAMSDFSRSFRPWEEHFSKGLYLAGVECRDDAQAPEGWVRWTIPGFEYLCVQSGDGNTFSRMLDYMAENGFALAGAVQDFTCPASGRSYMLFPIRRLG
ncbi:MAG: GyrI-like domain-containing protein [Clostridia bacterium]|nr:GyrI-like domain-containing protein [Clostridia bacterium]